MLPLPLLLSFLIPITSTHFALTFPPSRSSDDENQASFPCGGHGQTQNRTAVSLTSIPISLKLSHTENLITVALALGNDVGASFNTVLVPTIQEYGPGDFCWTSVPLPGNLSIADGTNGTIQVITNSHDGSGLYNCADITFTASAPEQPSLSQCTNGTGISATPLAANQYVFANESSGHAEGHGGAAASSTGASETGSATASGAAASATATESDAGAGAAGMMTMGWAILGAGVLGAVALM